MSAPMNGLVYTDGTAIKCGDIVDSSDVPGEHDYGIVVELHEPGWRGTSKRVRVMFFNNLEVMWVYAIWLESVVRAA